MGRKGDALQKKRKIMHYIDANVFLELELEDNRWKESELFLKELAKNKFQAFISDFHIYSILLVIETKTKSVEKLERFISALQSFDSLYVYHPTDDDLLSAIRFMKKYKLSFDDALIIACMIANNTKELVSFDSDFDVVKEIKRIEPRQV